MILDAHVHLEPELPPERLIEVMDAGGVGKAVLLGAAQEPIQSAPRAGAAVFRSLVRRPLVGMRLYRSIPGSKRVTPIEHPDNDAVFAAAIAHPGRFLPFVFVNAARNREAHEELDKWLEHAIGVKLHPWLHRYRLVDALPILKRAAHAGVPVLAHLGTGPPEDIDAALHHVPRLKLILAHAGIPYQDQRSWKHRGVFFDVAAPLVSRRTMRRLLGAVGPARVIYGSDAPLGIRTKTGHAYGELPPLPDRVMGENFRSLFH